MAGLWAALMAATTVGSMVDRSVVQQTVAQLSWGQNIVLLEKLDFDTGREVWLNLEEVELVDPAPGGIPVQSRRD